MKKLGKMGQDLYDVVKADSNEYMDQVYPELEDTIHAPYSEDPKISFSNE